MDKPDKDLPEKSYALFKVISVDNKSYLCDFYRLKYNNGNIAVRVILQVSGHSIWVDLERSEMQNWTIVKQSEEISLNLFLEISVEIICSKKF